MTLPATAAMDVAAAERGEPDGEPRTNTRAILIQHSCGLAYTYAKRAVDLVLGLIFTLAVSPILLILALAVLIDSGRPVFFRQERVGARPRRHGRQVVWEERRFRICKFRTMVTDADGSGVHQRFVASFVNGELDSQSEPVYKLRNDARVTRIGRFLRATSLDELPQLFNVIGGSMSLVGPRPVPAYEVELYKPHHYERLAARPGITGVWQVKGRGRVNFEEMMRLDIDYVRQQSLLGDLMLLARTPAAVLKRKGAA
jgi:lipopolysaccharide/colanic/teichoic acid biosynthesis glycosyltransferase